MRTLLATIHMLTFALLALVLPKRPKTHKHHKTL